jgi:O-antigen ligase
LALLTILILAYCLTSAVNSRATFHPDQLRFDYRDPVRWLPHSFDARRTWLAFWTGLGLVCAFWSINDWLGGKSSGEQLFQWRGSDLHTADFAPPIPARLRRLLWVLVLNGGVLALECIIQRVVNSPKLVFIVLPHIHQTADTQFGPYAYRANAAQYFNLCWPVAVGFWWTLNRAAPERVRVQHWLLVCGALMAACPIICTSRGGAFIALCLATGVVICLAMMAALENRRQTHRSRLAPGGVTVFLALALASGLGLGWKALKPRVARIEEDLAGREEIYQVARQMARDHPLFGIGPGAYESVSEVYRPRTVGFWPAQVHNDWLELRVTFGWAGSGLLIGALMLVVSRWFVRGGIHGGRRLVFLVWSALGGCLAHARYDFPLQVHSIFFLFVVLCAILFAVSRRVA